MTTLKAQQVASRTSVDQTFNYAKTIKNLVVAIFASPTALPPAAGYEPGSVVYCKSNTSLYISSGQAWFQVGTADSDYAYVVVDDTPALPSSRVITAGTGITLSDGGPGSTITINATGGGGAQRLFVHAAGEA